MRTRLVNRYTTPLETVGPYIDITRGGRWGNPFVMGRDGNRGEVLFRYRKWLEAKPDRYIAEIRRHLKGQTLVCCCTPRACHGDFLVAIAEGEPWPSHGVQQFHLFENP